MEAAYTVNKLYMYSWYLLETEFYKYSFIMCAKAKSKLLCKKVAIKVVEKKFSSRIFQCRDKNFLLNNFQIKYGFLIKPSQHEIS